MASKKAGSKKPLTASGLTWPEIRGRAASFAKEWADEVSERAEAQSFWNDFFEVFGVSRRRVAVYEQRAERFGKRAQGRIDVFWPGTLLAEHKSAGHDLDAAFAQATDYFAGIREEDLPRYVVVSDFKKFRLYDLDENRSVEFGIDALPAHIEEFGFIAGYARVRLRDEPEANIKAVQKLGELHDALKSNRYGLDQGGRAGHPLQMFLVRVLFCLFADDTGLFSPKDAFRDLIDSTPQDGSATGAELSRLFQVLDTPLHDRQLSIQERFSPFPHVNGQLFKEPFPIPEFDAGMRRILLECCDVQWANISPAIFGAMFQKIIELDAKDRRRQLGAHYTSERNILKLIGPLFLDDLHAELQRSVHHRDLLFAFIRKLRTLNFLDPACGCGNFLVITYRELRKLELEALKAMSRFGTANVQTAELFGIRLDQFHGIEIEEFPAQIAQVAMWLTQHQMDLLGGAAFGDFFRHLPLNDSANIRHGNALRLDWEAFVPPTRLNYILGNPPFVGKQLQSEQQKQDLVFVSGKVKGAGVLDFVAAWYLKAAQYLSGTKEGFANPHKREFSDVEFSGSAPRARKPKAAGIEDMFVMAAEADDAARRRIRCAFVSTNSICQGEQVGVLWGELHRRGVRLSFAHRTFKWTNEAPGKAAVHCVIVGFGLEEPERRRLFEYADVDGAPHERVVDQLNAYLVDAPEVVLPSRRAPLCDVPPMVFGSMPNDGGHLLLSDEERCALIAAEPDAAPWIRPFLGSEEFINGIARWCLWLPKISPFQLTKLPLVRARVEEVYKHRVASSRVATNKLAKTPTLFGEIRQPKETYLAVPKTSSEKRLFIPIGFLSPDVVASTELQTIPGAWEYHFGVISSSMHMAWVRHVCGRMKSDFRYSAQVVYNNFPWPVALDGEACSGVQAAAQGVLTARAAHPDSTLAMLYGRTMPPDIVAAHAALDRAVDAAYRADGGARTYANDAERAAFLFRRYAELTTVV